MLKPNDGTRKDPLSDLKAWRVSNLNTVVYLSWRCGKTIQWTNTFPVVWRLLSLREERVDAVSPTTAAHQDQ